MENNKLDTDFHPNQTYRGASIWHQVSTVVALRREFGVNSVCEIGAGRGVTGAILKHLGFRYSISKSLPSQVKLEAENLQLLKESSEADIVCAFQVLEHNPLVQLQEIFEILGRLSSRFVVISLPSSQPYLIVSLELKFFSGYQARRRPRLSFRVRLPRVLIPRARGRFDTTVLVNKKRAASEPVPSSRHFWEVGERGASLKQITEKAASEGLSLIRSEIPHPNNQHVFFVFEKC